jgi:type II secretory pathway pseudopilin PulG
MKIRLKCKRGSAGETSPTNPNFRQTGYTFAEVLVSAAILGFVATSVYGAFAAGFSLIQSTREDLRATQIMVQKTEAIRLFTWSQICDTNKYLKPVFVEPYDPLGVTNGCSGAKYTGYVTASVPAAGELPEGYRTNMRTITVTVYWTNYNGGQRIVHTREMQTRVARNGMQNYVWGAL